ncbi:hypothetical protein VNO80_24606 [Phaseolus coccineus]|uniref:Uncharacterized protein n=1 Tax=Phaseolus coccineus TaxID=3886 RepID=A0AAN9LT70_PHACN
MTSVGYHLFGFALLCFLPSCVFNQPLNGWNKTLRVLVRTNRRRIDLCHCFLFLISLHHFLPPFSLFSPFFLTFILFFCIYYPLTKHVLLGISVASEVASVQFVRGKLDFFFFVFVFHFLPETASNIFVKLLTWGVAVYVLWWEKFEFLGLLS